MNVFNVTGNLTRDPETKTFESGSSLTQFTIANNDRKNKDGEREVNYIDVKVWGKLAEQCQQYLKKGSGVAVSGRLVQEKWETPEGDKRSKFFTYANSVDFTTRPANNESSEEDDALVGAADDKAPF